VNRPSSRFKLAASLAGRRPAFAMAGDYLLSVSAYWPRHLSLYSPTGDPSKPGTGTALLFYGGACAHPELRPAARTSPRRDETVVPLGLLLISFSRSTEGILILPGEAESGSAGVQPDEE
jgi:hypothetical protein